MSIAKRIQTYLKGHGIKQAFIADTCGWSRQKTSYILCGRSRMTVEDYQALCKALGVPYELFLDAGQD